MNFRYVLFSEIRQVYVTHLFANQCIDYNCKEESALQFKIKFAAEMFVRAFATITQEGDTLTVKRIIKWEI